MSAQKLCAIFRSGQAASRGVGRAAGRARPPRLQRGMADGPKATLVPRSAAAARSGSLLQEESFARDLESQQMRVCVCVCVCVCVSARARCIRARLTGRVSVVGAEAAERDGAARGLASNQGDEKRDGRCGGAGGGAAAFARRNNGMGAGQNEAPAQPGAHSQKYSLCDYFTFAKVLSM
jgi:hypothetical protein